MIKKLPSGQWEARVYLGPNNRPYKTFKLKSKAEIWATQIKAAYQKDPFAVDSLRDRRRLSQLVQIWFDKHGFRLKDGKRRKVILDAMVKSMGDPIAAQFTAHDFTRWRSKELKKSKRGNDQSKKVTPATVNRRHSYFQAVFNELDRTGDWTGGNPIRNVRQFKIDQKELAYLTPTQQADLLRELGAGRNPHTLLAAMVCLSTGARWSEAETLTTSQLKNHQITFVSKEGETSTKSGKSRTVPISPQLSEKMANHRDAHPVMDENGRQSNRFFASCYAAFGKGITRAGIKLPPGQLSHVLRHTFASHFIQNSKAPDALQRLQKLLGHSDIKLTLIYAHLAPDALEEVRENNPLGQFWANSEKVETTETKKPAK